MHDWPARLTSFGGFLVMLALAAVFSENRRRISLRLVLAGLGAIDPERKGLLASLGLRSIVSGMLACFMTACYAGMLV